MKHIGRWSLVIGALGLVVVLALSLACGGDDEGEEPAATESIMNEHEGNEAGPVHIELWEWEITGEGRSSIPMVTAGEVTFEVHNEGEAPHELVIIKAETDPADLSVSGGRVDEEASGEEIGEVEEFPGGEIEVQSFDLEAGTYALVCNIAGHYEQGMYAQLLVE